MSNTVTNTPAATAAPVAQPVVVEFKGHKIVDNKVQANPGKLWGVASGESTLVPALQTEWDTKVAEDKKIADKKVADEKAAADKKADEAKWPLWKQVVLFIPVTIPTFIFNTIAGLISKICSIFGYGEEKKADKPAEQKTADKPATPAQAPAAPAKAAK